MESRPFSAPELETIDTLLTTTRSVRRRLDLERPVPRDVVRDCIRIAVQAPTASNLQAWRFVVVTDPAQRIALGEIYRKTYAAADAPVQYVEANREQFERVDANQMTDVLSSARHLVSVIERVPMIIVPCVETRLDEPIQRPLAERLESGNQAGAAVRRHRSGTHPAGVRGDARTPEPAGRPRACHDSSV